MFVLEIWILSVKWMRGYDAKRQHMTGGELLIISMIFFLLNYTYLHFGSSVAKH